MNERGALTDDDLAHCMAMVRDQAVDYYLADLLLEEKQRRAALVLHAFHVEIVNITISTTEPIAGEIRLQWWSDVLAGERGGEALGNPLARALLAVMDSHNWPAKALQGKLEAHIFDLYRNPMEARTMLEGWCGETRSMMFQLVAMAGGAEADTALADVSGHAGVAMGVTGLLENTALHRSRQQIFIPADILASAGLDHAQYLSESNEQTCQAYTALIEMARKHLDIAKTKTRKLDKEIASTFLPLCLVPLYLERARRDLNSISSGLAPIAQWRKQWALWRGL